MTQLSIELKPAFGLFVVRGARLGLNVSMSLTVFSYVFLIADSCALLFLPRYPRNL